MIEEGSMDSEVSSGENNELILGKFKSNEDLIKAYQELESKMHGTQNEEPIQEEKEEPKSELAIEGKSLEELIPDLTKEYQEKGELGEESYESLKERFGIPKDIVDEYIKSRSQVSLSEEDAKVVNSIFDLAGGQEEYFKMHAWAAENLSDGDIADYNKAMMSNDPSIMKIAARSLINEFNLKGGKGLLEGKHGGGGNYDVYESEAQMLRDLQNPLYSSDPAFTNKVKQKIIRSKY